MRSLDTLGSESPRFPQQNAPLDATGRGRNGNRPFNQGVAGSIPARPTNRINNLPGVRATASAPQGPNRGPHSRWRIAACATRSQGNCLAAHAELLRATRHSGALPTGDRSIRTTSNGESREGADETFGNWSLLATSSDGRRRRSQMGARHHCGAPLRRRVWLVAPRSPQSGR